MYGNNFRAQKVDIHAFSMIPRADIPRSTFRMEHQHKTCLNASILAPIYVQEVLPGDTFNVSMTAMCRLQTALRPIMDNMDLESWFFFVPNRLVWSHWKNFQGEQPATPGDSISYSVPQVVSPAGGWLTGNLYDYFGLANFGGQCTGRTYSINALPLRAYNIIFNEWFRDQNLDNAAVTGATATQGDYGDGPDPATNYVLQSVRKRHDYFTSALPWTQKGNTAITLPLGTSALIKTNASDTVTGAQNPMRFLTASAGGAPTAGRVYAASTGTTQNVATYTTGNPGLSTLEATYYPSNLYADLSTATAATINQIRLAFQTQRLLERDARGGTRYTEIVRSHFGVISPDARQQRPEYLGGGKSPVNFAPVPQTSATGITGGAASAAVGDLAAVGTAVARNHGFRYSATEHGYILGLVAIRTDQVYQNGIRRLWTRSTRYDFYMPVFAGLGEQAIRMDEIYVQGNATDTSAFGYQERWAEYRYFPSMVSGTFKSNAASPLDVWHLAQNFTSQPALNTSFMTDVTQNILDRNLALGSTARTNVEQFLCDFFFSERVARPMPMYGVPGLIDHF